jgi:hypothetical protein
MVKKSYLVLTAAVVLGVAACDKSTGLSTTLSAADATELAGNMAMVSTLDVTDFALLPSFSIITTGSGAAASAAAVPTTFNHDFDITKPCPKGGSVEIAGTANGTGDRATHSLTLETTAIKTDNGCAFATRHGIVTLNGDPNIAHTAKVKIVNGALSGPQTATHKGRFTWARAGAAAVPCVVDLASSFDPTTQTLTVTGDFCGQHVDVKRTRGN